MCGCQDKRVEQSRALLDRFAVVVNYPTKARQIERDPITNVGIVAPARRKEHCPDRDQQKWRDREECDAAKRGHPDRLFGRSRKSIAPCAACFPVRVFRVAPAHAHLSLAIVCPMANEAATAVPFVREVLEHCRDFRETRMLVVLDNVSRDNTRQLMEEMAATTPELEVIWAPENRSIADAYLRGHREALARGADWILEIDAGFSHQPSDIPRLFAKMDEGYDCVFGSRFLPGGSLKDSSLGHRLVSRGGGLLTNLLLGTKLHDMTSGFQLFSRSALDMILTRGIRARGPFFQTEMKTYCRRLRIAEVPIQYGSASHHVGRRAITDALSNLGRLFGLRLLGRI